MIGLIHLRSTVDADESSRTNNAGHNPDEISMRNMDRQLPSSPADSLERLEQRIGWGVSRFEMRELTRHDKHRQQKWKLRILSCRIVVPWHSRKLASFGRDCPDNNLAAPTTMVTRDIALSIKMNSSIDVWCIWLCSLCLKVFLLSLVAKATGTTQLPNVQEKNKLVSWWHLEQYETRLP